MFGAISWRRANRHGAFASLLLSSVLFFYLTYQEFGVLLRWEAANFGVSLLVGFVALVVFSLITKPEDKAALDPFYERLATRSYLVEATGQEKTITEEGHDLLVANLFNLELGKGLGQFYRRFRVDLKGLALACLVVVALIALAKGILYLP